MMTSSMKTAYPSPQKRTASATDLVGMKSIRMSVRKYGGDLTIAAENHIFNVNSMLCRDPVPAAY